MTAPIKALLIPATGQPARRAVAGWPQVHEIRRLLGTQVVAIAYPALDWHMYLPWDQASVGMALNRIATDLAGRIPPVQAGVHGAAVIVGAGSGGRDIDVPEYLVKHVMTLIPEP